MAPRSIHPYISLLFTVVLLWLFMFLHDDYQEIIKKITNGIFIHWTNPTFTWSRNKHSPPNRFSVSSSLLSASVILTASATHSVHAPFAPFAFGGDLSVKLLSCALCSPSPTPGAVSRSVYMSSHLQMLQTYLDNIPREQKPHLSILDQVDERSEVRPLCAPVRPTTTALPDRLRRECSAVLCLPGWCFAVAVETHHQERPPFKKRCN
jgi:hypothetical protein